MPYRKPTSSGCTTYKGGNGRENKEFNKELTKAKDALVGSMTEAEVVD
jgi:hypothetical protein